MARLHRCEGAAEAPGVAGPDNRRRATMALIWALGAGALLRTEAAAKTLKFDFHRGGANGVNAKGEGQSSGPLALSLDTTLHIRVGLRVNGVKASAILDSGAGRTIIDSRFVEKCGLRTRPGFNVASVTGNVHGRLADDVVVTLGALTVTNLAPGVLDLNPPGAGGGDVVDIVLGREVFEGLSVDIDVGAKTVTFHARGALAPVRDAKSLPLARTTRGTPFFPISINDQAQISAAFDLGYNATLLMSAQYAESTGLLRDRPVSTVVSRGLEGLSVSRISTLDRVRIGGLDIDHVPVEIPAQWNRTIPAIVGFELLSRFRIITDYGDGKIWFVPYQNRLGDPIPKDRSGIGAFPTPTGLNVVHVAEGSPAEACGLKAGDQIVAIDGERVDRAYILSHPRMGARPAGTQSNLTLADGRVLRLTLADYY